MKKNIMVLIILFMTAAGPVIGAQTGSGGEGATFYSEALYYKNLAIETANIEERNRYLDIAMEKLEKARNTDESQGRIFYQISEIFFLKGDITNSEKYANLSIEKENTFFPPYNRLYGILMDRKEFRDAAVVIEKYLLADPDEPYALYLLGVHYYKYLNDSQKSLFYFEREILISKSRDVGSYYLENSYYNAGYIHYSKSAYVKAFNYFSRAYGINESNNNTAYMLSLSAFGYYNLPEAEKYSLIYLKKVPGDANMEYVLGSVYYINGDYKAVDYLSVAKKSRTFEGLVAMGLFYELTGDDTKSQSIINAVMKNRPDLVTPYIAAARIKLKGQDKPEAYKALVAAGTACFRSGILKTAERLFYKAMELKGEADTDIYYFLARTHEELKNYAIAISYYNRFYIYSKETNILVHIGYIYGTRNKYAKANDYFLKAIKSDPENPGPYFFMGLVQIWEGKYQQARDNIMKAISIKNDEETYYFYLAVAYEKLNDADKSIDNLKQAIKYNKNSGRSHNYLGYLYADKNINIDEALTLINRALELEPDNGAYLDSLGWVYYRKGEYDLALKNLLMAEDRLDDTANPDPVVYDHLGDTYLKMKNKDKAVFYWEKSLKMEKNKSIEEKIRMNKEKKNDK